MLIPICFIVADYVSGFLKALYKKRVSSSIMRKGLYHKISELSALFLGYGIDKATVFYDLDLPLSLCNTFSAYIIIMEIISIAENLACINPQLQKLFSKFLKGGDNNE